ncbi:hypothetical protein NFG57_02910 [Halomonas sp. H10-59]|uniref:Uncharacterized protein n=1 Tax=Halomonas sp. H10-59 TaxID=2950874 RepID=A0AAU7KW50_9GAMM
MALEHLRDGDAADDCRDADGGAADRTEDRAGDDGTDGDAAGQASQPLVDAFEQVAAHPGNVDDLAHQHEQRYGYQYELRGGAPDDVGHGQAGGQATLVDDAHQGREPQGEGHGDAEDQQDGQAQGDAENHHGVGPSSSVAGALKCASFWWI